MLSLAPRKLAAVIDRLLQRALQGSGGTGGSGPSGESARPPRVIKMIVAGCLLAAFYGAVMGTFWGERGAFSPRPLQMLYSGLKVPMLLGVTFFVTMPSFFVLNTLFGVREDFPKVLRALATTQAALSIVLASLAPLTFFWYTTSLTYSPAIVLNGIVFLIASLSAQIILTREYKPLIAHNPAHRKLLLIWLVSYSFVGIQMGWTLRPFVGNPSQPTQFFRSGAWGNAYVEVGQILMDALRPKRPVTDDSYR